MEVCGSRASLGILFCFENHPKIPLNQYRHMHYVCTVEPLLYDHPQNIIGVVVQEGWSFARDLTIIRGAHV